MKATSAIALTIALTLPAAVTAEEMSNEEACIKIGQLAGTTMEARQVGVPLSVMLELASDTSNLVGMDSGQKEAFVKFQKELVLDAYETARYTTDSVQQRVISEFENANLRACLMEVGSD